MISAVIGAAACMPCASIAEGAVWQGKAWKRDHSYDWACIGFGACDASFGMAISVLAIRATALSG